jgi:DNA (cytosine-5)-methyltransferase 1
MGYLGTIEFEKIVPKEPTVISLFSGAGGMDVGFAEAGFKIRVMIEKHPDPCKTLRANFHWEELKKRNVWKNKEEMKKDIPWYHEPEPVILQRDITKLTTKEILEAGNLGIGEAIVVTGGPPCQGFSTAGKRILEVPRNQLLQEYVRVVRDALPRSFIMENVPGMVSMAKGQIIKGICEELSYAGYEITWKILNAADYGVPQNRKRVIIIGKRVDLLRFPEKGNPQLHMGVFPGGIYHPKWFLKKYNIKSEYQRTLDEYTEPETFEQLLQKIIKSEV